MLAAVESVTPPAADADRRAFQVLDQGLAAQPDSVELLRAKYRALSASGHAKEAVALVESKANAPRAGDSLRRLLAEVYTDQEDFVQAERVACELCAAHPSDTLLASSLIRVLARQATQAAERNDRAQERAHNEKAEAMIRACRARFPHDLAFLREECDLAARRGDLARATAITNEMDKLSKGSTAGPLIRARIYAAQGRMSEVADAYTEALDRNPRQPDVRILLGQTRLKLGQLDEALRQAQLVLELDRGQADAVLLQARALSRLEGSPREQASRREEAVRMLKAVIAQQPRFAEAYHAQAEIAMLLDRRADAIAALKDGLKANHEDAAGLAQLIQMLTEPRPEGGSPSDSEIADAKAVAAAATKDDTKGQLILAVAVGFHKAGQLALAVPWAEKAAARLDAPIVHLNYGDLLLSVAERTSDPAQAKSFFRRAVEQYDAVLKVQANSVEAVNNKAWILHTYLGESQPALELTTALLHRVDPATLPGEFFDTLGSIQQALRHEHDAEESYTTGLRKAPEHPMLNLHLGMLLAADRNRSGKASSYLERALANKDRLPPALAAEATDLLKKVGRN
jgi:tetratricopeptide (TPR) repeat protein